MDRICLPTRYLRSFSGAILSLLLVCAAHAQTPVPIDAESSTRTAATAPLTWTAIDLRDFYSQPGVEWIIYLEEAETGSAVSSTRTTPIRQTRLRICVQEEGERERDLAFVQHVSNLEIRILRPEDPALDAAPSLSSSAEDPWPNPSGFNFVETKHTLDIDEDDHLDLAIKFYATVGDPEARGLLLLDEGPDGFPNPVALDTVLEVLDPAQVAVQDLVFPEDSNKPFLVARYRPLADCRFLTEMDIPGEAECKDCCEMPVYFREIAYAHWVPSYYRPVQNGLLDRVRQDVATVSSGDPAAPLRSVEQAALARMASFFYLTGQGERTREQLETALGPRKDDTRAQVLMGQLERFFLTPKAIERQGEPRNGQGNEQKEGS